MLESKNVSTPVMRKAIIYYEQCEKWSEDLSNDTKIEMITNYLKGFGEWPLLTGKQSPGDKFDWKTLQTNNVRIAVAYGVAPYLFDIFIEEGGIPLVVKYSDFIAHFTLVMDFILWPLSVLILCMTKFPR